jgi:GntR family transcriptional regulator / MocR family aminotransferase
MSTTAPDLLIELDRSRPRRLRAQIEGGLRDAISTGRLAPGTSLPSSRALAADLGVTRGVVVAAYDQLLAEGYLLARQGAGTVVNSAPVGTDRAVIPRTRQVPPVINFLPSIPELSTFPRTAWLRATRAALHSLPDRYFGYSNPRGLPQLRRAIAEYLGRVRGVVADADQVVICNGFAHGLSLIARQLLNSGHTTFAVEDPGHGGQRAELAWLGAQDDPVPVDGDGIVVEKLRRSPARVVLVTPAHQFPTGAVLAPPRRRAIVAWARDVDGYVIEDDYDAEYRYDRHPVGAMQGLAPDRVIYCGTLSKSLAPGLRLGWLVLPSPLVAPIAESRMLIDHATSAPLQATFAEFLGNGDLDRHLRRMRRVYRERRDVLVAALARWLPDATLSGIAAGLHVLVTLPPGPDETALVEQAAERGIRIYPLGDYRAAKVHDAAPAMLLGYGNLTPPAIEEGVRILAEVVVSAARAPDYRSS